MLKLWKVKSMLRIFRSLIRRPSWRQMKRSEVILIYSDDDRYFTLENLRYSPIMDSLAEAELTSNGIGCGRLAAPYSNFVGEKAWGNPYHCNFAMFLGKIKAHLVGSRSYKFEVYSKVLRRLGCKIVLAIDADSQMCMACHINGMLCVEIAHGMGYTDFSYKYPDRSPEKIPDALVCYDDVTEAAWIKLTGKSETVWRTPHPWVTRFKGGGDCADLALPAALREKQRHYERTVILTLQWGYDGDCSELTGILPNGILAEEVENAIRSTRERVLWLIKLHPLQLENSRYAGHRDLVERLGRENSNVYTQCGQLPLPLLLSACNGHVTMISMACYEAGWMGVPSIAMCPSLLEGGVYETYFEDLVEKKSLIKSGLNYDFLVSWLEDLPAEVHPNDDYKFSSGDIARKIQDRIAMK